MTLAPSEKIVIDTLLYHISNVLNNPDDHKVKKAARSKDFSPIGSRPDALSVFTALGWKYNEKEDAFILDGKQEDFLPLLRSAKQQLASAKLTARRVINFYRERDAYGQFSNFSPHSIQLKGKSWRVQTLFFFKFMLYLFSKDYRTLLSSDEV